MLIDHINRDTYDNRLCNLRLATPSQNKQNSIGTSGRMKGVTFHKGVNKWQAQIKANGKHIYLGLFPSEEQAHQAYLAASSEHHGEFARSA
jgi:hypothetical protein